MSYYVGVCVWGGGRGVNVSRICQAQLFLKFWCDLIKFILLNSIQFILICFHVIHFILMPYYVEGGSVNVSGMCQGQLFLKFWCDFIGLTPIYFDSIEGGKRQCFRNLPGRTILDVWYVLIEFGLV